MLTNVYLVLQVPINPQTGQPVFLPHIHGKDAVRLSNLPSDVAYMDRLIAVPRAVVDAAVPDSDGTRPQEVLLMQLSSMLRALPGEQPGDITIVREVYVAESRVETPSMIQRATKIPPAHGG